MYVIQLNFKPAGRLTGRLPLCIVLSLLQHCLQDEMTGFDFFPNVFCDTVRLEVKLRSLRDYKQ